MHTNKQTSYMWTTKQNTNKEAVRKQRDSLILGVYKRGWTTTDIADMFNINQSTVSRIINNEAKVQG